jgi:hypothetical protein
VQTLAHQIGSAKKKPRHEGHLPGFPKAQGKWPLLGQVLQAIRRWRQAAPDALRSPMNEETIPSGGFGLVKGLIRLFNQRFMGRQPLEAE